MVGGVGWFLAAYALLGLSSCFDSLTQPGELWMHAEMGGDVESLQLFEHFVHPVGALAMGLLFDRRGARWCLTVCQLCALLEHFVRWLAASVSMMYVSKMPKFFSHTHLVLMVLVVQMSSPERRAHALAHAGLAHQIGKGMGLFAGQLLVFKVGLHAPAGWAVVGSLFGLVLARRVTGSGMLEADLVNSRVSPVEPATLGKATQSAFSFREQSSAVSSLPEPVAMPLTWPVSREGLVQLLARPVILQLILVRLCALGGQNIKDVSHRYCVQNEFAVLVPYENVLMVGIRLSSIIGMAFMIGPCIYRYTPRAFICICLLWKTAVGVSVAVDFSTLNPLRHLVPVEMWVLLIWMEAMWSPALQTVLTCLLASAVVRGQRGTVLGIDAFLTLLPYMGSIPLARWVYVRGGAAAIYGVAAVMNLASLLVVRTVVLPNYRAKEG